MDNDNLPISDPIDNLPPPPPPFMDPSDNLPPPPPPPPPFMDPNANFLVFPDNLETLSDITTVLFISDEITDYKLFYDSVNSTTFPIVYSAFRTSKTSVNEVLTKFTSIQRIGFAFHSSSGNEKKFLDGTPLFTDPDISNENVDWLLQVIKEYNVKNVDFLACDSLLYENWVKYFDLLHKETGVIVGASNDKTGNIKYGGDWVLESTGEDVELIYFTTSIEYYKNLLYQITVNGINYDVNDSTLNATLSNNSSVKDSIIIPQTISYNSITYTVRSVGNSAFQNANNLTDITLPITITSIGQNAFYSAKRLNSVTVPSGGLNSIAYAAFSQCSALSNFLIPEGVTSILEFAFSRCNFKSVILPSTLVYMPYSAFDFCPNLTSIVFPPNYDIGLDTCSGCLKLRYVTFGANCRKIYANPFKYITNSLFISFKNTSYLPISTAGTVFENSNTAYYKEGVLPPSGQGTDPVAYLKTTFNSTVAQIIDPPQLPITETTTWHLLSTITVNDITFTPAYANSGLVYLPYKNSSINPTVYATASSPFSTVTNITGTTNLTPNAYNDIQITVTSNEYNTYTWSVPVFVSGPSCFLEGSKILCLLDNQERYVPVEKIRKGTLVKTLSSGYKPVDMIGHAKVYNSGDSARIKNRLFKCSKKNYPELFEDLIITGCHSILVGDITEEQRAKSIEYNNDIYITENRYRLIACLDDRAEPYEVEGEHPIWHLALENNDVYMNYGIFANGLLVETASKRMMKEYSGMELLES